MNDRYKSQYRTMPEYNGWTNYPTWNIALWIDNDQGSSIFWESESIDCLEYHDHDRVESVYAMEERLKLYHEENNPLEGTNTYTDILSWALDYVNWREIAEYMIENAMEGLE